MQSVQGCETHSYEWAGKAAEGTPKKNCQQPEWLRCRNCGAKQLTRCGTSQTKRCAPCGNTYRQRVRRIAQSGWLKLESGGFGFLTLTAPSEKGQHRHRGFVCPCTPAGGIHLATWNGRAVDRWNDFHRALEREVGQDVAYFKGVEVQGRGALHLHVIIRCERPLMIRTSRLRALAMRHGYGHEVDLRPNVDMRAGSYVSKYVSKSCDERRRAPYVHRVTGEVGNGRWRAWTASRDWGMTMGRLKASQAAWAAIAAAAARPEDDDPAPKAPLDQRTGHYAKQHRSHALTAPTAELTWPM